MQVLARYLVWRVSRSQVISRYAYIFNSTGQRHWSANSSSSSSCNSATLTIFSTRHWKKLADLLPQNSLAIISSAPVKMMTDVVPYTFRQEADYLYLTGCQQPGGVAVLSDEHGLCMFMPETTPNDIAWQGEVAGVDAASEVFKAEQAYPMSKLPEVLSDMIRSLFPVSPMS